MASKTQNALVLEAVGMPIALRQNQVPIPKEGEIRIKVTVVGSRWFQSLTQGENSQG